MRIQKRRVYVETSIASFFFETRTEPEMVARRNWTRRWWETHANEYELVTSAAVIEELEKGDYATKEAAISLLADLTILGITEPIADIIRVYIENKIMPRDPGGDALHLALASYHKCDFLLTWNCTHIANANKFLHIQQVNGMLGLYNPALVTPLELLGEEVEP